MIKAVVFDISEVCLRGVMGIEERLSGILDINKDEIINLHITRRNCELLYRGIITEDEYWDLVIRKNNYPELVAGFGATVDILKSSVRENFVEIEGTKELIVKLKSKGLYLGSLSDHAREWVRFIDSKFDIRSYFDKMCFSYDLGMTKDSKHTFVKALSIMGISPDSTLFIDDSYHNIAVAQNAGIKYVHQFENAANLAAYLAKSKIM